MDFKYNNMTQSEYEQKRRECWEQFLRLGGTEGGRLTAEAFVLAFDRAYSLGKQETKQETDADTVIQGWVARDSDGNLFMFSIKPERDEALQVWVGRYANCGLRNSLFSDLTWVDEPQEVEIIIKERRNESRN